MKKKQSIASVCRVKCKVWSRGKWRTEHRIVFSTYEGRIAQPTERMLKTIIRELNSGNRSIQELTNI